MKKRRKTVKARLQVGDETTTVAYAADTIMTMLARESITIQEAAAGRRFRADFNEANCTNLRAIDPEAPKGGSGSIRPAGGVPGVSWTRTVQPALDALDGHRKLAAWHILGMGRSISEFGRYIGMNRKKAANELRAALGVLVRHYELT